MTVLCHFHLRPFWSYNSVFTEQESRECLKRKAASAHHQRSHAGLFIAFVSSVLKFYDVCCVLDVFQRTMEGFWKSVARVVPRDPEDMRILNPYFIQEAAFKFIGLPHNKGLMGRGVRSKHNNH